jgi:hypothetical protein
MENNLKQAVEKIDELRVKATKDGKLNYEAIFYEIQQLLFKAMDGLEAQTLPLKECYVAVSIADEMPTEEGEYFIIPNDTSRIGVLYHSGTKQSETRWFVQVKYWLKKVSLPLKEKEDVEALSPEEIKAIEDMADNDYTASEAIMFAEWASSHEWVYEPAADQWYSKEKEYFLSGAALYDKWKDEYWQGYRAAQKQITSK